MTIYYLSSVDGSNASDGLSWANAFLTFKYAVETASAAASGPHTLYVDSAHSEDLSGATTVTAAGDIRIVCVNRSGGDAPTTGAVVGKQSTSYNLILAGACEVYIYGMTLQNGTGSSSVLVHIANQDGSHYELENCTLFSSSTGSAAAITFGIAGSTAGSFVKLRDCTLRVGATSGSLTIYNITHMVNCTLSASGSSPTTLIKSGSTGANLRAEGCDFSHLGGNTLVGEMTASGMMRFVFVNCKLGASTVMLAAPTSVLNLSTVEVVAYNYDEGDEHFRFYHGDSFGETYSTGTVYLSDGAAYDGTNKVGWQIVSRASNCSFYTPYVSPWIDVFHSGTAQIAPYFEALRSGSTTKYQNDEVWAEFSYQGTSGVTKASFVWDRMAVLGTAADQTASSLGASDWTGEDASNNAYMQLGEQNLTPAEIGHIRGRVVVGEPNITVYIDPKIRGLS